MRASRDVLLVDDDRDQLAALARLLKRIHAVRAASSVAAALAEIGHRVPDVVISDLDMGPVGGVDLLRRVASAHPRVRRVLYSGTDGRSLVERGLAHVALVKPARLPELLRAIGPAGAADGDNAVALSVPTEFVLTWRR